MFCALLVQHLRSGEPAAEDLERGRGVDAVGLEEDDRLGEQLDVAGDDQLVGGLDGLARSRSGPTCTMVLPTASRIGLAASKSSGVPPTMIDSAALIAPGLAAGHRGVDQPEARAPPPARRARR